MSEFSSSAVCIARFSTPAEAHVALTRLQSAGLNPAIHDEFAVQFDRLLSDAIGGLKIVVPAVEETETRAVVDSTSCRRTFDAPLRGGSDADRRTFP